MPVDPFKSFVGTGVMTYAAAYWVFSQPPHRAGLWALAVGGIAYFIASQKPA